MGIWSNKNRASDCEALQSDWLSDWMLIIASNRGPVTLSMDEKGNLHTQKGGGGLVTALSGMAQSVEACWYASAMNKTEHSTGEVTVQFGVGRQGIRVKFVSPDPAAYDGYYNVIANPLLWFLQHSLWDLARTPVINHTTWQAWDQGYVAVNRLFAEEIARGIQASDKSVLVMLQDYQLYLTAKYIREFVPEGKRYLLSHFIHIPWPGTEDWGILPPKMRRAILESLCQVDLLGFQTREDGLNFIRTVESHLPGVDVNFSRGTVSFQGHDTCVRDFPISIDIGSLEDLAASEEVAKYRQQFQNRFGGRSFIVRIDRTEPSKNIVRGFRAFEEMLDLYPEHHGKVQFLALLVPSRLEVEEYQAYLDGLMAAAGRINARYGDSVWEPVRVLVGENYPRAVAALQLYDVLLVNSIADGMNLVAKEGPVVNQVDGVVILSERTGARQQLEPGAIVISPCDVYATAEALHLALCMPEEERRERANLLRNLVESEDIVDWLCRQLDVLEGLSV